MSIAPYHVALLPCRCRSRSRRARGEALRGADGAGVEVLYDDRDERAGREVQDADLVGLPLRVAIGKKGLAEGKVEWKARVPGSQVEMVAIADLLAKVKAAIVEGGGKI